MDKITGKDILEIYELEKKYEEMLGSETSTDIYPNWWYDTDYSIRKKIVNQALSKNSMIRNLEEVQEMEYRANVNKLLNVYEKNSEKIGKKTNSK